MQDRRPLPEGTLLREGQYKIIRVLGAGGFGITYRAWHSEFRTDVAIKQYAPSAKNAAVLAKRTDSGVNRFMYEASLLRKLEHPSIVRVLDAFREGEEAFFVMYFLEGETFKKAMNRAGIEQVRKWGVQLCEALEHAHSKQLIHGDIKPSNIIIHKNRAVLIDFGLANRFLTNEDGAVQPDAPSLIWQKDTPTPLMAGTNGYAALEQNLPGKKLGPATDIYGLGATLYHGMTGKVPVGAKDRDEHELAEASVENPRVPAYISQALAKALALRSKDRYQQVKDFRLALAKEVQASEPPISAPETAVIQPLLATPPAIEYAQEATEILPPSDPQAELRPDEGHNPDPVLTNQPKRGLGGYIAMGISALVLMLVVGFIIQQYRSTPAEDPDRQEMATLTDDDSSDAEEDKVEKVLEKKPEGDENAAKPAKEEPKPETSDQRPAKAESNDSDSKSPPAPRPPKARSKPTPKMAAPKSATAFFSQAHKMPDYKTRKGWSQSVQQSRFASGAVFQEGQSPPEPIGDLMNRAAIQRNMRVTILDSTVNAAGKITKLKVAISHTNN